MLTMILRLLLFKLLLKNLRKSRFLASKKSILYFAELLLTFFFHPRKKRKAPPARRSYTAK